MRRGSAPVDKGQDSETTHAAKCKPSGKPMCDFHSSKLDVGRVKVHTHTWKITSPGIERSRRLLRKFYRFAQRNKFSSKSISFVSHVTKTGPDVSPQSHFCKGYQCIHFYM